MGITVVPWRSTFFSNIFLFDGGNRDANFLFQQDFSTWPQRQNHFQVDADHDITVLEWPAKTFEMFYLTCTESRIYESFTFWNKFLRFHDIQFFWDAPVYDFF